MKMKLVVIVMLACCVSACSSKSGWTVNFGISPVSSIDNTQKHNIRDVIANEEMKPRVTGSALYERY